MTIRIDYSNMLSGNVPGGIDEATWAAAHDRFADARRVFAERRSAGELGFIELVEGDDSVTELRHFADGVGQAFNDVVVLGIGGSALGTIALRSALRSNHWNELDDEARDFFPRLHVLDNVDPTTVASLLDRLDLGSTLFIVISKSGSTAETMAQYLIVRGRLEADLPDGLQRHLVFITDPEHGALRALARAEGIVSLEVPQNVGGRYSVLSPVGLLPAALIGVDVPSLLAGGRDMAARCESDALSSNPAGVFAMLQWLADTRLGMGIQVLMPYSDALSDMGDWFVQLWAESLGKLHNGTEPVGPTPLAAVGATDQHSKVQLFMEGPRNKTVTFVSVGELERDLEIPHLHLDVPELSYLGGHRLGELLDVERRATAGALAMRGRPNMTIALDKVDEWHVGGLIVLLESAA
ncbi:MAG TPA: glucose-6-phosphate isomerase, partial [Gemmatimonadaceae bacterium]